jgi:hypothetical protein
MTPESKKALEEYLKSIKDYEDRGVKKYASQGVLVPEALGDSAMQGIETDPEYKKHELAALRELEDQSKNGFTAADKADMARVERDVGRQNRGRIGAIQQNMQSRGMSGSGMDLVTQMQSAQDANEIAAMRALEQEGMIQDRKRAATRDLGSMSANLQSRDFSQAAQKAEAADRIAQFNAANRMDADRFNIGNRQNVSNMNVGAANDFSGSVMKANLGGAQMSYDAATEEENRKMLLEQERRRRKQQKNQAMGQMIGGAGGAVVGGYLGGPAGAMAGASAGSQLGGSAAGAMSGYVTDRQSTSRRSVRALARA